jgi:hypothetical protein
VPSAFRLTQHTHSVYLYHMDGALGRTNPLHGFSAEIDTLTVYEIPTSTATDELQSAGITCG